MSAAPPGPGSGLRGGPPAGSGNAVLHLVLRDGEVAVEGIIPVYVSAKKPR